MLEPGILYHVRVVLHLRHRDGQDRTHVVAAGGVRVLDQSGGGIASGVDFYKVRLCPVEVEQTLAFQCKLFSSFNDYAIKESRGANTARRRGRGK